MAKPPYRNAAELEGAEISSKHDFWDLAKISIVVQSRRNSYRSVFCLYYERVKEDELKMRKQI